MSRVSQALSVHRQIRLIAADPVVRSEHGWTWHSACDHGSMSRELWAYTKWRLDDVYWELRVLFLAGPPFLLFFIVQTTIDGDFGVALVLAGILCAVPVYFFLPYVVIKGYRRSRWYEASRREAPHLQASWSHRRTLESSVKPPLIAP
jgi:hypothetical protein